MFPVDWMDLVLAEGPLPVVVVLHGGAMAPVAFLNQQMQITSWFDGTWASGGPDEKIKAFVIAPQGLSLNEDHGGDWNSGNVGAANRYAEIDDYAFILDCIERAEAFFQYAYVQHLSVVADPPVIAAPAVEWFDRRRMNLVGFSNGGQMAYMLAKGLRYEGWHVKGLAVFGCSIGGWYTEERRTRPLTPDVDWTPDDVGAPNIRGVRLPSVLHVHGIDDLSVQSYIDGMSEKTRNSTRAQLRDPLQVSLYARADISGRNSAMGYSELYESALSVGRTTVAFPPTIDALPSLIGAYVDPFGNVGSSFAHEWNDNTGIKQVVFAHIRGLDHAVPPWGPAAVLEFFRAVGGID